jgi:hypothetical protein
MHDRIKGNLPENQYVCGGIILSRVLETIDGVRIGE